MTIANFKNYLTVFLIVRKLFYSRDRTVDRTGLTVRLDRSVATSANRDDASRSRFLSLLLLHQLNCGKCLL